VTQDDETAALALCMCKRFAFKFRQNLATFRGLEAGFSGDAYVLRAEL
jgi:hypothetical protein